LVNIFNERFLGPSNGQLGGEEGEVVEVEGEVQEVLIED
jgi:hypothetical protein